MAARLLVALTGPTADRPLHPAPTAGAPLEPLALPPAGWRVTFLPPAVAIVSRRRDGFAHPGAAGAVRVPVSLRGRVRAGRRGSRAASRAHRPATATTATLRRPGGPPAPSRPGAPPRPPGLRAGGCSCMPGLRTPASTYKPVAFLQFCNESEGVQHPTPRRVPGTTAQRQEGNLRDDRACGPGLRTAARPSRQPTQPPPHCSGRPATAGRACRAGREPGPGRERLQTVVTCTAHRRPAPR